MSMWVLQLIADGGSAEAETKHHECRNCGENLSPDVDECPICGGEMALYTF
jgi:rRNA maturation endonuclease Nob1